MQAQNQLDSIFAKPEISIKHHLEAPNQISLDQEGNIYLLETSKHRIHKFFAQTEWDSVLSIGGKGIDQEGFNQPSKLEVVNRQSIYVLDEINRRLVLLNVNLRMIEDISFLDLEEQAITREPEDLWPVSFAAGPSGELYLLNQENLKIYKFNNFGNLESTFGGMDYGSGSLEEPDDICLNKDNFLFVSDTSNQKVKVFDLFGVFQYTLHPPESFRYRRIQTFGNYLMFFDDSHLYLMDLFTKRGQLHTFPSSTPILDVQGGRRYFYVLFENTINLYPHQ